MATKRRRSKRLDALPLVRPGTKILTMPVAEIPGGGEVAFDLFPGIHSEIRKPKRIRFTRVAGDEYVSVGGRWKIKRLARTVRRDRVEGSWVLVDKDSGMTLFHSGWREARKQACMMASYQGTGPFMFLGPAGIRTAKGALRSGWVVMDSRTGAWRHFLGEDTKAYARAIIGGYQKSPLISKCTCEVCVEWEGYGGWPPARKPQRRRDANGRYVGERTVRKERR